MATCDLTARSIDDFRADFASALRKMRAAPAFTAVVVGILSIAIGASGTVYSVIDADRSNA